MEKMNKDIMPSEIDFLTAYSNAKTDEEKEKIASEDEEKTKAYLSSQDKITAVLD